MAAQDRELLLAAFERIAQDGEASLDLAALARDLGRPLGEVVTALGGPGGPVAALARHLDAAMLAIDPGDLAAMSVRERLFELIMRRFETLQPFRAGVKRLMRDRRGDPQAALVAMCGLDRVTGWLIDAAAIRARGPLRRLVQLALAAVYARAFRAWLDDESADLAATMAELDKRLEQAERAARWLPGQPPRAAEAA